MASQTQIPTLDLNDGAAIPQIALGTVNMLGDEGVEAIVAGIGNGCRLLDTAVTYENEGEVGRAAAESGIDRSDLFITSKVSGRDHGFGETLASTEESLTRMGLDYLDLHLIHWPNPSVGKFVDTWHDLIEFHRTLAIQTAAWSSLHRFIASSLHRDGGLVAEAPITDAAAAHEVEPSPVVLRWHLEVGSLPISKSATPERQRLNADIFGFSLPFAEVEAISALERGRMKDQDPDTHKEK